MADYRDWAGRRPRPRAARVPAAVAIVAIDRAHQWQCAPVGGGSTVRGCTPVPYVQLTVKLTDERCGCRALTALDRSEDRRSALSIRAHRTAVCAPAIGASGHAAGRRPRSIRTEHAPLPRLPPHIHRDRHTVHIRDTRLCRNEPGYRVPRQSRRAQYRSGVRGHTIQIRIQTHAQIRADAVHQGTLRTRVARAHKSGDAFRLWPV